MSLVKPVVSSPLYPPAKPPPPTRVVDDQPASAYTVQWVGWECSRFLSLFVTLGYLPASPKLQFFFLGVLLFWSLDEHLCRLSAVSDLFRIKLFSSIPTSQSPIVDKGLFTCLSNGSSAWRVFLLTMSNYHGWICGGEPHPHNYSFHSLMKQRPIYSWWKCSQSYCHVRFLTLRESPDSRTQQRGGGAGGQCILVWMKFLIFETSIRWRWMSRNTHGLEVFLPLL